MTGPPRVSRRAAVAALAVAGLGTACRAGSGGSAVTTLDEIAERYVRLALALAQHQPSLVEQWLGPGSWRPGPRRPVAELRREVEDLHETIGATVADAEARERVEYLRHQVAALSVAARRLSGEAMSFVDEAQASLGADVGRFADRLAHIAGSEPVAAARADLERQLPGRGPLHERYADFRTRHSIAPARLGGVMAAALDACRARVRARIDLPDAERVELASGDSAGLEGRAQYAGGFRSRVSIAASGPLDLARLVWLIAHESYPGHHVQHVLADRAVVLGHSGHERLLHPSFGRHLLCAEGTAEAGAALLLEGTGFRDLCRELAAQAGVRSSDTDDLVAVHRLVSMLDLAIAVVARAYLDGEMGGEAAAVALTEQALVLDAQPMLAMIERQRTRVLVYPIGRRLAAANLNAAPEPIRWERLASMATTLTLPGANAQRTAEAITVAGRAPARRGLGTSG